MPPLTRARAAAEAPTLLETLARAPAAAALVVAALGQKDRKALRLAHPQLRDAVSEATTKLRADFGEDSEESDEESEWEAVNSEAGAGSAAGAAARPPTPRRWPCLEELRVLNFDLTALEALGSGTWDRLRLLDLDNMGGAVLDAPHVRTLAAALRRMPALRALGLWYALRPASPCMEVLARVAMPQLRSLAVAGAELTPASINALVNSGWRLEVLCLEGEDNLSAAGVAALVAAPTFAIRRLTLCGCNLDAAALLSVANAPWPLEQLSLPGNDFSAAAATPALAALSRHARLRRLALDASRLSAAGFKALVEAHWPALTHLNARQAGVAFDGPHALGAAAFASFPALEELNLSVMALGEAGAALLAGRQWPRLRELNLFYTQLGDAGVAALARGEWPALERLILSDNRLGATPTLAAVRRWAPALMELQQ